MAELTRAKFADASGSPVDADDRTCGPADWHRLEGLRRAFDKHLAQPANPEES